MKKSNQDKSMINNLTSGSVTIQIFTFAMPLFFANALQAIYNIVDMVVVGQVIGGAGMSAVSIGGDVLHLLTFLAMGFSSAGQVLIAQYVGANKERHIKKLIGTMFTLLISMSLVLSLICILFRHQILNLLNTPAESYDYTLSYMLTCAIGLLFIYGYNCVSAILRGMGDSKRPFAFIAIAAIMNIVLDIVFVVIMHMEVFGAALATVVGQAFSFIVALIYLYRHREMFGFDFKRSSFGIHKEVIGPLLALGIPMAIQSAAVNISKTLLAAWINNEGVVYSALAGIYNKSSYMMGIIANSFLTAGSTMTSQNIGARKYKRVVQIIGVCLAVGLGIAGIGTLVLTIAPVEFCSMFTSDQTVLAESSIIIMPMILNFFGCATRTGAFALINGSANPKLNLAVALLDGILGRIGFAALFGFGMHMACKGFWFGDAVAGFFPMVVGIAFFLSGRWKREEAAD